MALLTQGTKTGPFQYTGEQRDGNGLVYLRARMYDPQLGRFLRQDSLAGLPPKLANHEQSQLR
ncbi:MAG: hypothetical protein HY329_10020 [Chloroflexi bacterium]|nr:hypothetical protein [Chloroflexota bacterium]